MVSDPFSIAFDNLDLSSFDDAGNALQGLLDNTDPNKNPDITTSSGNNYGIAAGSNDLMRTGASALSAIGKTVGGVASANQKIADEQTRRGFALRQPLEKTAKEYAEPKLAQSVDPWSEERSWIIRMQKFAQLQSISQGSKVPVPQLGNRSVQDV